MNLRKTIFALFALLATASCMELPLNIGGDKVIASVEDKELKISDLTGVIPRGLSSEDSLLFVGKYAEKWIANSVKLLEAERVFASSALDIEAMVEEYRNSLMVRKLEKNYISENYQTRESEAEIEEYYAQNCNNFRLTKHLVKGRILTFPKDYKGTKELLKQMTTIADKKGGDFRSICEKKEFDLVELTTSWVDYSDFLSRLPIVRQGRGDAVEYLSRQGVVQQLEDGENRYFFQITEVLEVGDIEPIERARERIIYILNNKNQSELLRNYEADLLRDATQKGVIRNYTLTTDEGQERSNVE